MSDTRTKPPNQLPVQGVQRELRVSRGCRTQHRTHEGKTYGLESNEVPENPHIVGTNFGIVTEILTAPNGNLVVVSLDRGTVYEIFRTE
jgi:hypothetical protein